MRTSTISLFTLSATLAVALPRPQGSIVDGLGNDVKGVTGGLIDGAGNAVNGLGKTANGLVDGLGNEVNGLGQTAKTLGNSAIDGVTHTVDGLTGQRQGDLNQVDGENQVDGFNPTNNDALNYDNEYPKGNGQVSDNGKKN